MDSPSVPRSMAGPAVGSPGAGRPPSPALDALLAAHFADGELVLPLLPTYATQVVALCSDPSSDARSLAQLLQRDPALAAHVLAIANSAALGAREKVVSLQQAIARMGVRQLASVALSIAVKTKVFKAGRHLERVSRLWHHSAVSGLFGREIARMRRRNVESAFLCGLLHDVGGPVVLQAVDEIQVATRCEFSAKEIEAALTRHHAEVGARLVRTWGLPEWTSAAARHHHAPEAATECLDEVRTAHLADRLADFTEGTDDLEGIDGVLSALGLYEEDLDLLQQQVEQVRSAAEVYA
ncbi:MAG: HDOD domain-containing protein [Planctomycetes bacterium]|nr:HDOD domain-containing protein [Planctomycetota bacterium]